MQSEIISIEYGELTPPTKKKNELRFLVVLDHRTTIIRLTVIIATRS